MPSLHQVEEISIAEIFSYHRITFDPVIGLFRKIHSLKVFAFDFQCFIGLLHFYSREEKEVLLRRNIQLMTF